MLLETSPAETVEIPEGMKIIKSSDLVVSLAVSDEVLKSNINTNIKNYDLPLYRIENLNEWRATKEIAIVGGGPSLHDTMGDLHKHDDVMVCGSAHDFLIQNHIRPKWTVLCDPDPIIIKYIKYASPYTTYLVASQCHPSVFEYLQSRKCRISLWHAGQNIEQEKLFGENKIVIRGGCTVGLRAIPIAINFGYSLIHLFGFDNCLIDGGKTSHAYDFQEPEYEKIKNAIDVGVEGVMFKMADYHLAQLMDFKEILKMIGGRAFIKSHGHGAITHLLDLALKRAIDTVNQRNSNNGSSQ